MKNEKKTRHKKKKQKQNTKQKACFTILVSEMKLIDWLIGWLINQIYRTSHHDTAEKGSYVVLSNNHSLTLFLFPIYSTHNATTIFQLYVTTNKSTSHDCICARSQFIKAKFEKEKTTQWPKEKSTKGQTTIFKT